MDAERTERSQATEPDREKGSRRDEKDHRSKERERELKDDRLSRRKEDRDDRDKDRRKDYREERDKYRERERDRDRKDRPKEREREAVDKENDHRSRDKERSGKDDRGKEKSAREKERDRVKEKEKERDKHKEKDSRDRDGEKGRDREKDDSAAAGRKEPSADPASDGATLSTSELEERILKAKEERAKKKSEGVSEVLDWVSKSRKIEEKRIAAEKEKAAQLARTFEEQDNIGEDDSENEEEARHASDHLAGVKVLHGLDKVIEGGAVVLTLKDQNILADGDINEDVDMLENVEIGEQKRRDDAYKASKKKTGIYVDKFNDDPATEKKMLPQYDDPVKDEGVTLDARGRLTGEAEKKLAELRKRLEGASSSSHFEDLTSTSRVSLDYYTQDEMVQFKKPKKKKSLRKREKLDLDALEAEAISTGLGSEDLGSRKDSKRQGIREEQERSEAERRNKAYQAAVAKAQEQSKLLRLEQTLPVIKEDEENTVWDDDDDFYRSLDRARKFSLKKEKGEEVSGPKAIALLAAATSSNQTAEDQNQPAGEAQENKVVITEMEEFVWGLQLDEESRKPDSEDVFMEEDEAPIASDNEQKDEARGVVEVDETMNDGSPRNEDEEEVAPDETIHEAAVGKGLSGALRLLKDRGTLKETVEWGGRNMDKKKSKLVGIMDEDGAKEIRIDRRDEFGRILTPKEAFRNLSHKFHGKGPGKRKQEKRLKQFQEELKLKQMKNADTPSMSAERMREAQAQMKTPYLVLSGHVKPGQNSDPRSAFATIEKDTGSLTPMLGDRKVELFLGIKRKSDSEIPGPPKKPKT